jgi:hypothetical protein
MKNLLKQIYYVYKNTFDTFVSILSVLLLSSFNRTIILKKLIKKLKQKDECVIMGNGPSLLNELAESNDKLTNKDIFVVNFFCCTRYFEIIKPFGYVLLDPELFNFSNDIIMEQKVHDLISKLNQVNWNLLLCIPYGNRNSLIYKSIKNKHIYIFEFNAIPINGVNKINNLLFQYNLGMPMPQTVIIAAIFLALNMNYKKCHLYGVEQSWLKDLSINNKNEIMVGLDHFYPISNVDNYQSGVAENRSLSEFLFSQAVVFKSHMDLNKYSIYKGSLIINHTPGSYIDAYTRN